MKKLIVLLLVILLASSCTKTTLLTNGDEAAKSDTKADSKITLQIWHTYSDMETEVFENKVIPLFESTHPRIKIQAVRKDYTPQLKDHIFASVADNKQPDMMRMDIIWVPEFARNGSLADLSEMNGFSDIRDSFIGALIKTNLYRNKYYGLPVNANTKVAIYNKRLLKEAGLTHPPNTFDELIRALDRLHEKNKDIKGIGICCSSGWGTLPYFWTFGGKLMDDNYTRASGYLDHPDSLAAIAKIQRLYRDGVISPSITGGEPGSWDGVLQGKILMIEEAHWFYTVNSIGANKDLLNDMVIGLFPDDVHTGTSIIGGENLVLFKNSKHVQESWEFMKWMVSEEPQQLMAETGLIPTIKHMQDANQNPLFTSYLQQLDRAQPRPPVSTWTDIDNSYARMIEQILTEELPLEDAVREAVVEIDKLLMNQ
ncbi:extracellular solute-binding protein [Cohnella sp. WQ 127256]|uniref:extracellular solute-binding protein n=1 Tax=Cohnella sp. WQ 127256 TaxID=2938790 RepID=UPI0021185ACE|nr:extracellular solute-binding protein [Cohnella sp. WQ 127256]